MKGGTRIPKKVGGGKNVASSSQPVYLRYMFPSARDDLAESPYNYLHKRFLHVEPGAIMPINPEPKKTPATVKYRLVAKIGFGGFSTVWLAGRLDKSSGEFDGWFAIKIMAANMGDAAQELNRINEVRECGVDVAGFRAVKDTWKEVREDNKYLCMPMEFSGPTVRDCMLHTPEAGPRLAIAFNAVDIMDKLHSKKVFIADFTAANLLVKVAERVKKYSEDEMYTWVIEPQIEYTEVEQGVLDKNGKFKPTKRSRTVPERLYAKISLTDIASEDASLDIIDLYEDPKAFIMNRMYTSPKAIATEKVDKYSNIWSLGVILCELLISKYPYLGHPSNYLKIPAAERKAQLKEYCEIVCDCEGVPLWNKYQQNRITYLLFHIFDPVPGEDFSLAKIKEELVKIDSGKQEEEESVAEIKEELRDSIRCN